MDTVALSKLSNEQLVESIETYAIMLTKNYSEVKWEELQDLKDEAERRMDIAK